MIYVVVCLVVCVVGLAMRLSNLEGYVLETQRHIKELYGRSGGSWL